MHNHIETPICQGHERTKHPTQKPVQLMQHFVKIASNPGDLILDPFMGSGSTGVAALSLDRDFVGFEIDPSYVEIARSRMPQFRMLR